MMPVNGKASVKDYNLKDMVRRANDAILAEYVYDTSN